MSEETNTTNTTNTKPAKKAKAVVAAPPADAVDSFGYEMLEADSSAANVDPKTLIFPPFDSRADSEQVKLDPSFAEDVKANGVLQPPLVTPVRHRETGKTGFLIVAGRQRVRAAIAANNAKNKVIPVHVKTMTVKEAVIACGIENIKRKALSFWDEASYMRMLKEEFGLKQTEIKDQLGVADSKVSQYLAVFDLDERVQKLVRRGQLDPGAGTKVRALKALKDPDQQYALATKAIEAGWTSDDIEEAVTRLEAKAAAAEKAARERDKAKKASAEEGGSTRGRAAAASSEEEDEPMFDPKAIAPLKKAEFHALLEAVGAKIEKMRSKDSVDEAKLAYERGKLDGLKLATGLKALPKSLAEE
jgi:ParB/RepB/Spo0J family partition protein